MKAQLTYFVFHRDLLLYYTFVTAQNVLSPYGRSKIGRPQMFLRSFEWNSRVSREAVHQGRSSFFVIDSLIEISPYASSSYLSTEFRTQNGSNADSDWWLRPKFNEVYANKFLLFLTIENIIVVKNCFHVLKIARNQFPGFPFFISYFIFFFFFSFLIQVSLQIWWDLWLIVFFLREKKYF